MPNPKRPKTIPLEDVVAPIVFIVVLTILFILIHAAYRWLVG
jgi:hypothetical protein